MPTLHSEVPTEIEVLQVSPLEDPMFFWVSGGVRTDLEHELTETFGPAGRARQAFTRTDAVAS
jgi:hypothetical protein